MTKKKFTKYLIGTEILMIFLIFLILFLIIPSSAITHLQVGEVVLTHKNFTYLPEDVCTTDNNWCGKVEFTEKAIIYGSLVTEVSVPKGAKEVYVWTHIPCNSLGEGLYGRPGSVALISVDNESKPETIKSSHNKHHGAYYKYDYCESFLNSFNVNGSRIILKIEMIGQARLDIEKIVLKFYDGEGGNGSENLIDNKPTTELDNHLLNDSLNDSLEIDSDNDGIKDFEDNCPEIKGQACNNGCPVETDFDVDGLQEDNKNCPDYDEYPYDHDNDNLSTIEDCNDSDDKNTKIKGDDDGDGVSNCIDKCPDEKGEDEYGCPKVVEINGGPGYTINRNIIIYLVAVGVIISILIVLLVRK